MSELLISDTALSAGKVYSGAVVASGFRYRFPCAVIVLHTSGNAGNRRAQLIVRPAASPAGHGIILADTAQQSTINSTFYGVGGPTANGTETAAAIAWVADWWFHQLVALELVVALQAGDTVDVYLCGFDEEEEQ